MSEAQDAYIGTLEARVTQLETQTISALQVSPTSPSLLPNNRIVGHHQLERAIFRQREQLLDRAVEKLIVVLNDRRA